MVRKQGRRLGAVGYKDKDGYLTVKMGQCRKRYFLHRIAWAIVHGKWPQNQIDHVNGIKSDNRLCNLREASNADNMRNVGKQAHNTSGLKGVSWHKHRAKWRADTKVDGKRIWLGLYDCPAAASFAYQIASDTHHGVFSRSF